MPKMHVDKAIVVNKSVEEVFSKLRDFHHWTPWSPWLILEEDVKVNTVEDGKFYEWEGDLVGSGNMTIAGETDNKEINIDLMFLKPWKSRAKVNFILIPEGENTRVHWTMDSSLPFFMFWMKKMMTVFIGMDYERGLNMLKEYLEDGKVHSKLEIKGIEDYPGCQYVGYKVSCSIPEIGSSMKENFEKLMPFMHKEHAKNIAGNAFSIFHQWKPVKNRVEYTVAVPVSSIPGELLPGMISGSLPKTKVHSIKHTGPYTNSGNAWSAQMIRQRGKKFAANKKFHPVEVYLNSPKDTEPHALETEVLIGVK